MMAIRAHKGKNRAVALMRKQIEKTFIMVLLP